MTRRGTARRRRLFWAAVVVALLALALAGAVVRAGEALTRAARRPFATARVAKGIQGFATGVPRMP